MKNNGIDIFSGAGGMSLGAMLAGIKIDVAIESNPHASSTYSFNHPEVKVISDDIRNVSLPDEYRGAFIVFGGPPCQGFSLSNTKTRDSNNTNNTLFEEFIRFVKEINPAWFVFENVEGIVTFEKGEVVKKLTAAFEALGYKTKQSVLCASDYGVPQNRNRFFMVGNRLGIDFTFPEKEATKVSVMEAIRDLPELSNGDSFDELPYKETPPSNYAEKLRSNSKKSSQNFVSRNQDYIIERYKYIGQGENWKSIPKELMENYKNSANCHSGIYKRLNAEKPSVVIANYRKNMLIHPLENRGLSVREASRIQSFPDDFVFKGSLMHIQQQIGNAVPPLLAKALFQQIIKMTKDNGED